MLGAIIEKRRVNITWTDVGALEYTVEYRKKGSSRWYTAGDVKPGQACLYNLQFGKEYEYRVGCRCVPNDVLTYSAVKSFKMPDREEKSPQCGIMPESKITNRTPVDALVPGQPFMAGDFTVFVTKVSGSGTFSGEGYVGIPYLNNAQVAVTFNNIAVNTDLQLISGYVETKFDPVNTNLVMNVDKTLTGGQGVGDIRSGEERAAFEVTYVLNPNIKIKPLVTDSSKDDIKEGGDNTFVKGENGKYRLVFTDGEGNEHIQETDSFPFTVKDGNGNTYEVALEGNSGKIKVAQELVGYTIQDTDTTINKKFIENFKEKVIRELINDIKSKIDIDNYTDTEKKYLQGVINHTDFISSHTELVAYLNDGGSGWYENGILYATYRGSETENDVKISIFHEYLHHINYLYKIYPYRYSDELKRHIYIKDDNCFLYRKRTLQEIYEDFCITLGNRLITEDWNINYINLTVEQKKEVNEYREKNASAYAENNCFPGTYKPSNYYQDELNVYEICLKLNGVIFNMSEEKKSNYNNIISTYFLIIKDSQDYELRNNINTEGYEK
jgi:hypothetical protein